MVTFFLAGTYLCCEDRWKIYICGVVLIDLLFSYSFLVSVFSSSLFDAAVYDADIQRGIN